MRKGNKVKPEKFISILKTIEVLVAQGKTLDLACREVEITRQTYYKRRKEFWGLDNFLHPNHGISNELIEICRERMILNNRTY